MWDFFGVVSLIFGIIIFLFMLIFTWVFAATFVISGIYAVFVYDYKSWTKSIDNYAFIGFIFLFGSLMIVALYNMHLFFWATLSMGFSGLLQ